MQYSQGAQLGTYTKPYTTRQVKKDGTCYVDTPTALPTGIYELEEVSAPDGYILQAVSYTHLGNPSETLSAEADSDELYEGTKVKIRVTNTGMNIWAAEITCEDGELEDVYKRQGWP